MKIGDFDTDRQVLIIAEIGNNHEGRFELAAEMVRRAAEAGANAVKFQTFRTELFTSRQDPARFERLKSFELSFEQFARLRDVAQTCGVLFLSTPFDLESARFLGEIVPAIKIASGDNTFYPLIETVARLGKPCLLSSGLLDLRRLRRTIELIRGIWLEMGVEPGLSVLQCVTAYPVPPEEANLAAISTLAHAFGTTPGYSDHTLGIEAAVLAVAAGARIVEKHFTLDKEFSDFRDHQLSADPSDLKEMVARIRQAEILLGDPEKKAVGAERENERAVRRSIAAGRDLAAGTVITPDALSWVRPAGGLPPGEEAQLLGRRLRADKAMGESITPNDVV